VTAPNRPVNLPPVGYPVALEACAALLAAAQVALGVVALDRLPTTVVPYFGPGSVSGLAGAGDEARLWASMIGGAWVLLLCVGVLMYRSVRSTPLPILSVTLLASLAVLRAGALSLNLDPSASPRGALLRAGVTAVAVLGLAASVERSRSRARLAPALVAPATVESGAPRGPARWIVAALGLGVPLLFAPERVRVIAAGVLVVTPVSYFLIPRSAVERVERVPPLLALIATGINLASDPARTVRVVRRGRALPVLFSVADPDAFVGACGPSRGDI
jgi:hypothetical protein